MTNETPILSLGVDLRTDEARARLAELQGLSRTFGAEIARAFAGAAARGRDLGETLRGLGLQLSEITTRAALVPIGRAVAGGVLPGLFQGLTDLVDSGLAGPPAAAPAAPAVHFTVNTPDAESFRRSETQIAAMMTRAMARGRRNL